jgi:peptide/nickel transport system substrate-binding protein
MSEENMTDEGRREFLTKAGAASGMMGLTALAGCSGGGGGEETTAGGGEETTAGGGEETTTSGGGSGEMGDKLPTYTYTNNAEAYNPPRHDAINLNAQQLGKLGLDMNVEVLEWGTLYNRVSQEYDYSFATWHTFFTVDPGLELFNNFHSQFTGPGEGNYAGYENEEVDQLLEAQMAESDPDKRQEQLYQLQDILMDEVPRMPITQMPATAVYHAPSFKGEWVSNISGFNSYYTMINLEMADGVTELKGYWPETFSTMNVLGHNGENKHVYQFNVMYDKLIQFDENFEPDPEIQLAQEWERVDESTMRYTIREGHTFHDGESLTAEDVAFTFNYIKENEVPYYSLQNQYIDSAEAVDDTTVEITLAETLGPFNTIVGSQIPILPKHKWEGRSNPSEASISEPVGSGPVMFDYWDKGSELGLKKFPDHFAGVDFEKRFWRVIPESSTVWELLKNGELNYEPFGRIDRNLAQNRELDQIGFQSEQATSHWMFTPNERKEALDQVPVRKAAVNAIPRTPIVKQLLFGIPEPGFNVVSKAFGNLHNSDVTTYEESVETGKQRLRDAGYVYDDDGMVHFPAE